MLHRNMHQHNVEGTKLMAHCSWHSAKFLCMHPCTQCTHAPMHPKAFNNANTKKWILCLYLIDLRSWALNALKCPETTIMKLQSSTRLTLCAQHLRSLVRCYRNYHCKNTSLKREMKMLSKACQHLLPKWWWRIVQHVKLLSEKMWPQENSSVLNFLILSKSARFWQML